MPETNQSGLAAKIDTGPGTSSDHWRFAWMEIVLICGLFFLFAGSPPPGVNEAHYLAKAKHFWDPHWCGRDLFLDSSNAHPVFFWLVGWITLICSLPTTAWVGRAVTWLLLAIGWQRLSWAVVPLLRQSGDGCLLSTAMQSIAFGG